MKLDNQNGAAGATVVDAGAQTLCVPTFRAIGRRVLQLLDDPVERGSEIADLILADAGLTLHLLSEANRAVLPAGVGIVSVPVALEVVGRDALTALVHERLREGTLTEDVESLQLYRHSLVTSLVCESLARVVGSVDVAAARTAGLLHDVGAWDPATRHDSAGAHARLAAKLLRRMGLPDEICRAVANHHSAEIAPSSERGTELVSVLNMADRVATALCVSDKDIAHTPNLEEGALPRLRALAWLAMDRAAREVADSMMVLGTLIGVAGLTLEGMVDEWRRLAGNEIPRPLPPPGLSPEIRRGLDSVRQATTEAEAIRLLMRVVRGAPGVKSALLILEEAGEAMLDGHPEKRPFFVRLRDLVKVAENFEKFMKRVHDEGAGLFTRDPAFDAVFSALKSDAILAIPVSAARTPVGVIVAAGPGESVTSATAGGLGLVARVTGEVLETLQLSRGSYLLAERIATDDLTGVLNRGHFFERFAAEVRAANRYRRPLSLAMIDIDHFKGWNDRYGHQVGDRILRDVSKTIRDCAREADMVGRYGGDEFVVSLPGCTTEQAMAFADRVRERVHGLGMIMRESCYELTLSVSIGVASSTTWPCESDVLLFRADHALYRAKERGRNRVCADPT